MLSFLSSGFYIFLAILVLLLMITIHEFGHYISGKKLGFTIKEFSIGFGKKLYSRKLKNGETFSIRIFPLGGYCSFLGEDEHSDDENAFNNKAPWKRIIVLVSGAFFNILSAVIFTVILLSTIGFDIPEVENVVGEDNPNVGILEKNDIIWEVEGEEISFSKNINTLLSENQGDEVTLTIERDNQMQEVVVERFEHEGDGIGIEVSAYSHNIFEASARSIPFVFEMSSEIIKSLGDLLTGQLSVDEVGGPVTTVNTMANYAEANLSILLVLLPLIAVNLGIFNLIPIPALDGSRVVFTAIEWIRGKPIDRAIEGYIHFAGFMILIALILFIDLSNLIG